MAVIMAAVAFKAPAQTVMVAAFKALAQMATAAAFKAPALAVTAPKVLKEMAFMAPE